ncbi:MAG: ferritin-like domain-containing protein [Acidimicrobiales bacterium]
MEASLPTADLSQSEPSRDLRWRLVFERESGCHRRVPEPDSSDLTGARRRAIARSLATFQVGESGTGEHIFAAARASGVSDDYFVALRCFVAEEQEHARLLALVLVSVGQPLRTDHWTDHVFVVLRRVKSLRSEVLTLLVAEVIALRYYSALRDGIDNPALADIFGRIHEDEVRHVAFHAATLPEHLGRFSGPVRLVVRALWNVLVAVTSVVVALDHGRALAAVGVTRRRFVVDVHGLRVDLDRRLFSVV